MQVRRFRYTEFSLTQLHHEYTQVYFSSRHLQVDVYIIYLSIYIYIYIQYIYKYMYMQVHSGRCKDAGGNQLLKDTYLQLQFF